MIETHPFDIFIPDNARYLILGSFIGKQAIKGTVDYDASYDFYYGTKRNQFWPILEAVYGQELRNKRAKLVLFSKLGIAIGDIIYQCERMEGSNLDANLKIIQYNKGPINDVLANYKIEKIFFTSRYVENLYKKAFKITIGLNPLIELICLPSPSPRFARMTREQKIDRYKALLPEL
jgi:hypoxanthine-DNA glycosylase